MKKDWNKVNGCGACSGIMKYIPVPQGRFFEDACNTHDILYNIGGGKKERKNADARLYNDMVNKSTSIFVNRIGSHFWFTCLAFMYYLSVRAFGRFYFNFQKSKDDLENS